MSIIYKHTFKTSTKSYIGKSTKTLESRLLGHIYSAEKNSQTNFHRAIRKYGIDDIVSETLEQDIEDNLMNEREIYWIDYHNTFKDGYNMTIGGDGGNTRSNMTPERYKEYCNNISKAKKGKKFSEEHKAKISIAKTNNPTALSGKDNGRAKKINIYNKDNKIIYETHGDFQKVCEDNSLPYSSLVISLGSKGQPLNPRFKKYRKFKGWYALESDS